MATETTSDFVKKSEAPRWPKKCAKCGEIVNAAPYWYSSTTKELLHDRCMAALPEETSDTEDALLCLYDRLGEVLTELKTISSTLGLIHAVQVGMEKPQEAKK